MHQKAIKFIDKNINESFENKTIVITGGNSGIGKEVALQCAYLKMHIIIAIRSLERGSHAIEEIKVEYPNVNIELAELDLSNTESIRNFANYIIKNNIDIDYFYHNAGVYRLPYQLKEGRELVVSTNYYGPYLLTSSLLDYLHQLPHPVKMIFTSSIAAKWAKDDISILLPKEKVSRKQRYANSKLLDAYLFKYLFDNDTNNIHYILVHPGVTNTSLFEKAYKSKLFVKTANIFIKIFGNPLWKSALTTIYAVSNNGKEGTFYGPTHFFNVVGYPHRNKFLDKRYGNVQKIINKTEELTGQKLLK